VRQRSAHRSTMSEWPERWPLLGPAAGATLATTASGIAISEVDWGATTVFMLFAVVLFLVLWRNLRALSDRG
jgi:hypothetical protein